MDSVKKKKKKSRKSKNKDCSSPPAPLNGVESAQPRDEDQSRPSKRKHESDPERKKKKKKKHHAAKDEIDDVSMAVAENEPEHQAISQPEALAEPRQTGQNGVEKATPATPTSQPQTPKSDYPTTGELNSKGMPRKLRGSRPGGKDNLKVGFFTPDEVEKVENFMIQFCTLHGLRSDTFKEMVQHSERGGAEFPCLPSITTKHEFWSDIYSVLPDRDRRSLYRFTRRHFQITGQKAHEWTAEQDDELVSLMKQHPAKYAYIGKILGRSDDDVTQRWKNRLEHREKMNHGAWDIDELQTFMKALQEIYEAHAILTPASAGKDVYEMDEKIIGWGAVSDSMRNRRSRQQCADKWRKVRRNVLAMRANGNPDAVFDLEEAVRRSQERSAGKSQEFVTEDEADDVDEGPVATSTPTSDLKYGFVDQQKMMALASEAANDTPAKSSFSPRPDVDVDSESIPEAAFLTEKPDTPAAVHELHTPSGLATPLSSGNAQTLEYNRMARIKEKIKAANKSKPSKKRRHSNVEPEPEPVPEASSPSKEQQSEKERKREKKRRRKEKRRQRELEREREGEGERARIEPEVAETPAHKSGAGDKVKKQKKHRKSHDVTDVVNAIAAAEPEKKKKKHRKSDMGPSATVESPESSKKPKEKKKKQASREENKERPTPSTRQSRAPSETDESSSDNGMHFKKEDF